MRAEAPSLEIRLRPQVEPSPLLEVELVARGLAGMVWEIPALAGAEIAGLQVRDDLGDLPIEKMVNGQGIFLKIGLGRGANGGLRIRYTLRPGGDEEEGLARILNLRVGREHVLAAGEQVLLLPAVLPAAPVRLTLVAEGPKGSQLVSSLGVEAPRQVRLAELRRAAFLIGPVGHAVFRGPDGADDFAWTGELRFDPRWAVAETAGARSAVDAYFGAEPGETARFTGLLAVDFALSGDEGAVVVPRGEGLYVALGAGARWNATTRLALAQGLVHRWIGGRLRVKVATGEPPQAGAWFSEGVARFVAREVLWALGTLSTDDYAAEINAHLAEVATAPLRNASNAEVAAAAAGGDVEAHALLVARGVLVATRLNAEIQTRHAGRRSLQTVLQELVAEARAKRTGEFPLEAFMKGLVVELGEAGVAGFREAIFLNGKAPAIPAAALGKCFTRGPRRYVRFDVGFDVKASRNGQVRGVRPGGPAARAGVREGETLVSLVGLSRDPYQPVEVTLAREGGPVVVRLLPVGMSGRGEGWRRRERADEAECPR